jgi:ATP-binding cassette subfamily F protein 3
MPIASLANIEKTFGQRVVFQGLEFAIDRGERVGLIGDNGSGKTTLLKLFTGDIRPDQGVVAIARSVKAGYLQQDPSFDPSNTVMDEAELAFAELHDLSHRLRQLEHDMAEQSGDELERTLKRYQATQHEFDLAGGYAWRHRLQATLQGVGLASDTWEQPVNTLSGGQRSRLALAKLLIGEPDLLLLDEPTNHLDLAAVEWLEDYLLSFKGAVLLISHDRYLLDRLATRIVWLSQRRLKTYPGNYSAFVEQRGVEELSQQRAFQQQQEDIAKQQEFIRRFGAGQRSREAKGREKRLNRLLRSEQLIQAVEHNRQIHLKFSTDQRAGDRVLEVKELSKRFPGKTLWDDVHFTITRGQRVGIIGPNGSGKTTLLRVLLGEQDADAGEIRWGSNLNIGYYDQRLDHFDPANTVLEEVLSRCQARLQHVRNVLGSLLFRGDDVDKPMGVLSGGERARVALALLLLDEPNVLLLDEPTNHLDIASCEALEQTLRQFPGTILCVSHDRYFLDHVIQDLLIIQPPGLRHFAGNYTAWHARCLQAPPAPQPREKARRQPATSPRSTGRKDNPYARPFGRLSVRELESQITQAEIDIHELNQRLADPDTYRSPADARQAQEELTRTQEKLKAMEAEYFAREH